MVFILNLKPGNILHVRAWIGLNIDSKCSTKVVTISEHYCIYLKSMLLHCVLLHVVLCLFSHNASLLFTQVSQGHILLKIKSNIWKISLAISSTKPAKK